MKMMEQTAHTLFASKTVYEVPPYQRSYVWEKTDQWQPLWSDLTERAERVVNGGEPTHFMGAVVLLKPKADQRPGGTRIIVDGQQRLVTVQILCIAVENALKARGLTPAAMKIAAMTPDGTTEADWKMAPSLADKEGFRAAMETGNAGHEGLVRAKRYFREECNRWLDSVEAQKEERGNALADVLCQGLTFGVIELDDEETQYAVFETLNARGTPLSQSDLAKNHVVEVWRRRFRGWPSEDELKRVWPFHEPSYKGKTGRGRRTTDKSDEMLRYWLSARTATEVRSEDICKTLKQVLADQFDDDVEHLGRNLSKAAARWTLWTDGEVLPAVRGSALERIRAAGTWAWGPVLMALDEREDAGPERESRALRILEAYMMRRKLAGMPTQGASNLAVSVVRALDGKRDTEAAQVIAETLAAQDADSRRWATAEEVERGVQEKDLYHLRDRAWAVVVLEAVEEHLRHTHDDKTAAGTVNIEHIFPVKAGIRWGGADEVEHEERKGLLHTAGNLIVVEGPLNSSLGNKPWSEKRQALEKHTHRKLTRDMLDHAGGTWGAETIRARSKRIAQWVQEIWPIAAG